MVRMVLGVVLTTNGCCGPESVSGISDHRGMTVFSTKISLVAVLEKRMRVGGEENAQ